MKSSHFLKKQAVLRHSKINTWSSEHSLTQKPKRGDSNAGSNRSGAGFSQRQPHYVGGRGCRRGKTLCAQYTQTNEVHGQIQKHHTGNTDYQTTGQVLSWFAYFTRNETRSLPAPIRK